MPDRKAVEDEIVKLEKRYWNAIKDNDLDTALSLTDDPCIVTGPQGVSQIDKKSFEKMMKDSPWKLEEFELGGFQVRKISDELVVAAYKVKEKFTVDGKAKKLEAAESSTWIKRNGKWVCTMHTESIQGDPFARA